MHAVIYMSESVEDTSRLNPNVNRGLQVVPCQCRLIGGNKCIMLLWDIDIERGCTYLGTECMGTVCLAQFCYKPETALKVNFINLKVNKLQKKKMCKEHQQAVYKSSSRSQNRIPADPKLHMVQFQNWVLFKKHSSDRSY